MLAMNAQTPRSFRMSTLSLTSIASMLAPTGLVWLKQIVASGYLLQADYAFRNLAAFPGVNLKARPVIR